MSNKDLYKKIVQERKDIPLFLKPWWMDTVCKSWDVAIAKKGDQVAGVWPYPLEKAGGGYVAQPEADALPGAKGVFAT